jgi:Restriction endonuclease
MHVPKAHERFTKDKELALRELIQTIHKSEDEILELPNWNEIDFQNFENLVHDLLLKEGLRVKQETDRDLGFDFTANSHGILPGNIVSREKWLVETTFYKNSKLSINTVANLYNAAKLLHADTILLVTNSLLTNIVKNFITDKITDLNVFVWDVTVLSDLLNKHENIRNKYFTPLLIKKDVNVNLFDSELIKINNMVSKLNNCPEGREGWKDYENICIEILNYLFVPPLREPKIQSRTVSGLDIRDALYPNRGNHPNWKVIRDDYEAKYILIEFKNFSENSDIDKEVVNQARNYLKKLVIGRIAFICSNKKPNRSGIEAQKQAFYEETKLILFLKNENLIEMLMKKYQDEDPSDVILDMIDNFNLTLG